MGFILCFALSHGAGCSGWRLTSVTGRWRPWWPVYSHGAPCGGEARLVGARGLRPFFLAKKKGPKKTRLAGGLRSHAARLDLLFRVTVGVSGLLVGMVLCFY